MAKNDTKTEQMLDVLGNGGSAAQFRGCCNTKTQSYILDAIDRVQNLEDEVEEIKNNPDVVDIVATYADLEDYDTSGLTDKDIIRVLVDETHDDESTYYRWSSATRTWTYVGSSGSGSGEDIGDLADLNTTNKTDIVSAINEVNSQIYDGSIEKNVKNVAYTIEEVGCVLKDGTLGLRTGGSDTYYSYKFVVSQYESVWISGRQFGYGQFNPTSYPWGADACICVAYDENDTVLQYWQLGSATSYTDYKIDLPSGTSYIKVAAATNYFTPAVCNNITEAMENKRLPEYWLNYLYNKKDTIMSKCNSIGANGDSFVFITDIHAKLNYGKSPLLINWILKQTPIRKVIFGGDLWSDGNNIPPKEDLLKYMYALRNKYNFTDNLTAVRGNHDVEQSITAGEWYSMYERVLTETVDTVGTEPYFYTDNKSQKIRYIFCDGPEPNSAMPATQQTWLSDRITELAAGWTVLVFCHSYWRPANIGTTPPVSSYGSSIKAVIDTAVSTADATVAALVTGHVHRDMSTTSSAGYAIVATTCDANDWLASRFDPVTPDRVEGTTTEQVFDVFNIDTSAKKIHITRIGGNGTDRTLTYA